MKDAEQQPLVVRISRSSPICAARRLRYGVPLCRM
jgi:hypothetical protein